MQKGYAAEPLAPVRIRPRSQIQCGIVRIRPKWGSPPTVKVDLFTYRVRLRGRAEGSSTWISERHRPGRAMTLRRHHVWISKPHLVPYIRPYCRWSDARRCSGASFRDACGFDSRCGHKASERKGLPKAGKSSSDSFGVLFHSSTYYYYCLSPE